MQPDNRFLMRRCLRRTTVATDAAMANEPLRPGSIVHGRSYELLASARVCWAHVVTLPVSPPTSRLPAFADTPCVSAASERDCRGWTAACSACRCRASVQPRMPGVRPRRVRTAVARRDGWPPGSRRAGPMRSAARRCALGGELRERGTSGHGVSNPRPLSARCLTSAEAGRSAALLAHASHPSLIDAVLALSGAGQAARSTPDARRCQGGWADCGRCSQALFCSSRLGRSVRRKPAYVNLS